MNPRTVDLDIRSIRLTLLPERAVWVQATRTLLVADLHLGKATTFRRHGVPVPESTTADNLDRLEALVDARAPQGIVFLGDFLHAPEAHARVLLDAFVRWRERHAGVAMTLVRGNHDRRAGDPPPRLGVGCVDEPWVMSHGDMPSGDAAALRLCHHPQHVAGALVVAGHVHPCAVVGRGFDRLRLPCFHLREGCLTMPAFGAFTGTHPVERAEGDRVFVVAPGEVVELPA